MDKGFLVFGDIEETLDELTDDQVGVLFRAMVAYHNNGVKPEFDDLALKYAFIPIRQQMDRGDEAYRAKCEKNRQNALKRSDRERSLPIAAVAAVASDGRLTKTKTDTDTNTDTDTKTESTPVDVWVLSRSVLSHLNDRAGTHYRTDAAESVRLISELHHKGYTAEQMIAVIDKKVASWLGNPKVEQYLRPSTLFGPKFEQYLNEPDTARKKAEEEQKDRERTREKARSDVGTYEAQLKQLRDQYEAETEVRRRIDIKGDIAVLEAKLEAARAVIS
ncbi:MAG: conserved phage C-terminal domain-containing protein [Clostridia bacterium]|nr:conserved phage C-terminal domain-containing protein [Clostridia bacterium]